ncbi:MAG TPA: lamin tail domain-containing protein [Kofleriaceae bacterium]|nr:lamin tail domain-containing protein [Kofleriaceae bacterium]
MKAHSRSAHWLSPRLWLAGAGLALAAGCADLSVANGPDEAAAEQLATGSPDVVISQVYGGGGNTGATFSNDYVELFNRSASAVSLTGWSVQYASATGSSWQAVSLSGSIAAGGYYLVQLANGGTTGGALPAANASGTINMSGSSGKVALVTSTSPLSCGASACLPNAAIRDFVGYGSATQAEGSDAPTGSNTVAEIRAGAGCTDSDNNAADFATGAPAPRNSSAAPVSCGTGTGTGGGGGTSSGDGTATRLPCTGSFGSAMSATFGRLDGFLVSIVNINGSATCRGDNNHVHLQVQVNGKVEDIAVNVQSTTGNPDVFFRTLNAPLSGGAWVEGWHTGARFDYFTNLGVHSTSFTETPITQLQTQLDSLLANANHVSIFATGFDGTGGHDIHRQPTSHDGAIVINPTTGSPTYLLFRFDTQSF